MIRRLYNWVLKWAETPYALWALLLLAIAEASFFPLPPDVLLIAMAFGCPKRGFRYAAVCSAGSVGGGLLGYGIGAGLMDLFGCRLVSFYHGAGTFDWLARNFAHYDFWAVFVAAVTPIPYKIFTITAGAMHMDLGTFMAASTLGRPLRFFSLALLIYFFGPAVRRFLERYFNLVASVFVVLLIGGFLLMKGLGGKGASHGEGEASAFATICSQDPPASPSTAVGLAKGHA